MAKTQDNKLPPNPEVKEPGVIPRKRKNYTAEYKLRVLKETDLLKGQSGAIGAYLRKEGLYTSVLAEWRKQRDSGSLSALSQKRGRKPKHTPAEIELMRLEKENQRLSEQLRQANLIIEAQKKISEILQVAMQPQQSNGVAP